MSPLKEEYKAMMRLKSQKRRERDAALRDLERRALALVMEIDSDFDEDGSTVDTAAWLDKISEIVEACAALQKGNTT